LDEANQKPKFKVPAGMLNDWTGDRFVYERPYGAANVQLDSSEGYAYDKAE
jgi:hypothetical protein